MDFRQSKACARRTMRCGGSGHSSTILEQLLSGISRVLRWTNFWQASPSPEIIWRPKITLPKCNNTVDHPLLSLWLSSSMVERIRRAVSDACTHFYRNTVVNFAEKNHRLAGTRSHFTSHALNYGRRRRLSHVPSTIEVCCFPWLRKAPICRRCSTSGSVQVS